MSILTEPKAPLPTSEALDVNNPRSILHLLHSSVAEKFRLAMLPRPEWLGCDEHALREALREHRLLPTPTVNRLRMKFWQEYDYAVSAGKGRMLIERIYGGVCHEVTWQNILTQTHSVAWILTPPSQYQNIMQEALLWGLEEMRTILQEDLYITKRGQKILNIPLAKLKFEIIQMIDQRVRGAVTQKIEQRSLNVNVTKTEDEILALASTHSSEELEHMVKALKLEKEPPRVLGPDKDE